MYEMENKKCSKPPTSCLCYHFCSLNLQFWGIHSFQTIAMTIVLVVLNAYHISILNRHYTLILYGWWYTNPSQKYEFVSWDYCSQLNGKIIQSCSSHHQSDHHNIPSPLLVYSLLTTINHY